ncbi:MAG: SUMF1/EgtB/PvdO family nonheme iron enzyme, partial [Planctomycetota bacterium]|jgi:hypothetical protein
VGGLIPAGVQHEAVARSALKPYEDQYNDLRVKIAPIDVDHRDAATALKAFKDGGGAADAVSLGEAEINMVARGDGAEDWPGTDAWREGIREKFAVRTGLYDVRIRLPGGGRTVALYPNVQMKSGDDGGNALVIPTEVPQGMIYIGPWTDASGDHGGFFAMQQEATRSEVKRWAAAAGEGETADFQDELSNEDPAVSGWAISDAVAAKIASQAGGKLPNVQQWQDMAYGPDGRRYPWGSDAPEPGRHGHFADTPQADEPTVTGQWPDGASPYGIEGLLGGVAEWVIGPGGGVWGIGGYFATSLEDATSGTRSVLREPKPGPMAYKSLSSDQQNSYATWKVDPDATAFTDMGLRLIIELP